MHVACLTLLMVVISIAKAWNVYVATPNSIRLAAEERVAIAVEGEDASKYFEVYVQDHPGRRMNLSNTFDTVFPANPKVLTIKIEPSAAIESVIGDTSVLNFVNIAVHSTNFHREIIVPISYKSGYLFLQTDKPIYNQKQQVQFRIIPLNEDGKPSAGKIKLQIKNPKGIVVQETEFSGKSLITPQPYKFSRYPLLGVWSATALYGYKFQQSTTVTFELREYVLPTFAVKLKAPEVILPSDESIPLSVEARFVYGKPVSGIVVFKLGIKADASPNVTYFTVLDSRKLVDGSYRTKVSTEELKNHKKVGWFPEGSRFIVEATVTDDASGQKEVAVHSSGRFSTSPFVISFKRCLTDFKPGLVSVIEADVSFVDGTPAAKIRTTISAVADGNISVKITNPVSESNEEGKVLFQIQPEMHHKVVTVVVKTDDPRYDGSQAVGHHTQNKFSSVNSAYIAIARKRRDKPRPGEMFTELVYMEPANITDVYYMVTSKGRIILIKKLPHGKFRTQRVEFIVTHEMVPSFRIVVFAEYKNELIADSLLIDVANECDPKADVTISPRFGVKEPGSTGTILINGTKSTVVALLAVDSAVYALSDRDRLTKSKMFKSLQSHDLGCGPGGGLTSTSVLRNAGVVIATRNFHSLADSENNIVSDCEEKVRKKREVITLKLNEYDGTLRQCCALGMSRDKYNRNCHERTEVIKNYLQEKDNCSETFLECCLHAEYHGVSSMVTLNILTFQAARSGNSVEDLDLFLKDEEDSESNAQVRSDFRETWLFDDAVIGPDGTSEFQVTLPDSITTWVIQAVSVSQAYGMCVATPQTIESFKKIFVQLNLPYSVVRNEQIEIPATVFNYGDSNVPVVVYMHGVKDLCSGTQEGQKSERKRFVVPSHSGKTVSFPAIPLMEGVYDIKVSALSLEGSDVIIRKLNVVAEGKTVEEHITIKLDPTNQQQRQRRHITNDAYSDSIDDSQNLQVTAIKLRAPDGFIPGTESCTITAIGDEFGPTVETSVENPEELIKCPKGCAEQAMVLLAPTLYTMRYLKATNKITPEIEAKGYENIRKGYDLIFTYRKDNGSYGAYLHTPSSTWLTTFITKVFCQASNLVHIDEEVMCSAMKWLALRQQEDGSFIEGNKVYFTAMMGGVQGQIPLTAFVLIALQECSCDIPNFHLVKARALAYLEERSGDLSEPLPVAIVAYALALSDSELKHAINDKLMGLSTYDSETNMLYWKTHSSSCDVEATGYALLTQLLLLNMKRSNSIVNWLNSKRGSTGAWKSTQDTVVALQALSEYAIRAKAPSLNLVSNITSSNDRTFMKTLVFNERNSLVLQEHKVDKLGGLLFVNTAGHGVGLLTVKVRYNVPFPPERLCKFDVKVTVTDEKENEDNFIEEERDKNSVLLSNDLIRRAKEALDVPPEQIEIDIDPRNRPQLLSRNGLGQAEGLMRRVKREDRVDNSKLVYGINICTRYLGDRETDMSIVDAGIFSGFRVNEPDLKKLVTSSEHLIDRYELSSKGIVFYLGKVPTEESYCFKFRIVRDYIVGGTQTSIVKVYAYYDPDESCTVFYSPDHNSPLLRKICSSGICQCAEGGCPSKRPFARIGLNRDKLKLSACEDHDYVWIVKVVGPLERKDGFLKIKTTVKEVVKEGIEKTSQVIGNIRVFLARDNCETAELFPDKEYLIMAKDGEKYENENGEIWHRYLLEKTSKIHIWTSIPLAKNQRMMSALHWLREELTKGCDL